MSATTKRIKELVLKRLETGLNKEEQKELDNWMNASPLNREAVQEFLEEDSLRRGIELLYQTKDKLWKRLEEKLPEPKTIPILRRWQWVAAAAVIIVFGTISYELFIKARLSEMAKILSQTEGFRNDVAPGSNKAMLTLADGRIITLNQAENGTLATQGNTQIIKMDNGQLVYSDSSGILNPPAPLEKGEALRTIHSRHDSTINTLTIPRGGQYRLTLADGTRVWLNAASGITFPTAFTGKERRVEIKGEAYFEVAKNTTQPFIVNVNNKAEINVLGTHFNVNAYEDENGIKTTLLEGRVSVSSSLNPFVSQSLNPGQQAIINTEGGIVVQKAAINETIAWKNGIFQFNETDLRTVMRRLERWYDVEVEFQGEVPAQHFGGAISRQSNLSQVLKMLEISGVHFAIEGKKVTIRGK